MKNSIFILLLLVGFILPMRADVWSFSHDNDIFFNSDDTYTGALFISWTGEEYNGIPKDNFTHAYTSTMSDAVSWLGLVDFNHKKRNASISFQEVIMTPYDVYSSEPVYTDVPYVGIIGLHFSLFVWDDDTVEEFRAAAGIIGPLSGAKELQRGIHKIIGNDDPKGWDNQLSNYPIFNIGYLRGMKHYEHKTMHNTKVEWFNSYYGDVGNFYIGAGAGSMLRFGKNMPNNFSVTSSLMSAAPTNHINFTSRSKELGWAVNAGIFTNAVGYTYLYEESARLGYDYNQPSLFFSGKIAFNLYIDNIQASLELYPTTAISQTTNSNSWGRIHITWSVK